ncbi:MAG: hypothetical protein JW808_02990, partial [Victivallales bacterium]|nr:hypothetical protein [Victivallales bacterium]
MRIGAEIKIELGLRKGDHMGRRVVIGGVVLLCGVSAGYMLGRLGGSPGDHSGNDCCDGGVEAAEAVVWTCSMHPQIRQPKPGRCPLCDMDLIRASSDDAVAGGVLVLKLSERAAAL